MPGSRILPSLPGGVVDIPVSFDANPGETDGDGLDEVTSNLLPEGFYEVAESAFEHEFSTDEEAIAALEAAGFERGKFRFSA